MSDTGAVMSELAEPPDIERTFWRLRGGEVFVELLDDSVASRAAALEALLGRISDSETKLIWIGNPLRSPLTIERLFLQAAGPEADLRFERSPAELVAMLHAAADGAVRCLMIVQQPETLDPEARDTLARIASLLIDASPLVQFLFCGTNAFRRIEPLSATSANLPALTRLACETIPEPRAAREKLPLLLLLLIAGLGSLVPSPVTEPTSRPVQNAETASTALPTPQGPVATPEGSTNSSVTVDTASLRREFDAFLAQQSPATLRLNQNQRDALFDEFLARQQSRSIQNKL